MISFGVIKKQNDFILENDFPRVENDFLLKIIWSDKEKNLLQKKKSFSSIYEPIQEQVSFFPKRHWEPQQPRRASLTDIFNTHIPHGRVWWLLRFETSFTMARTSSACRYCFVPDIRAIRNFFTESGKAVYRATSSGSGSFSSFSTLCRTE